MSSRLATDLFGEVRRVFRAGGLLALFVVVAAVVVSPTANARVAPVIESGREAEILALIEPYTGRKELGGGYHVERIDVKPHHILLQIEGAKETVPVKLVHPDDGSPDVPRTPSFRVVVEGERSPEANRAIDAVVKAIVKNDDGAFWPARGPEPGRRTGPDARRGSLQGEGTSSEVPPEGEETLGVRLASRAASVVRFLTSTMAAGVVVLVAAVVSTLREGIFWFCVAVVVLLLHLRRVLGRGPRRDQLALLAIFVVGALVRFAISPEAISEGTSLGGVGNCRIRCSQPSAVPALRAGHGVQRDSGIRLHEEVARGHSGRLYRARVLGGSHVGERGRDARFSLGTHRAAPRTGSRAGHLEDRQLGALRLRRAARAAIQRGSGSHCRAARLSHGLRGADVPKSLACAGARGSRVRALAR